MTISLSLSLVMEHHHKSTILKMYPQNKDLSWKENGYGIQQVEKQI